MTDKKAHELFSQYMQAEIKGNDQLAEDLEAELNKGGYIITAGPEGLVIVRKDNPNAPKVDGVEDYIPQENKSRTPLQGDKPRDYTWLWVGGGIIVAILLIIWVVKIIKKRQYAAAAR